MKYCIMNGDDFGASRGINRGIVKAHREGVLTSTSLMVDGPWSEEAAELARDCSRLSVGLHVELSLHDGRTAIEATDIEIVRAELRRQCDRFISLTGSAPTHLDSHHNVHRHTSCRPLFRELAARHQIPLRDDPPVKNVSSFYGQWGGETHPEQISVASLVRILHDETTEGFIEISCHPGYVDSDLRSSYATEREQELRTVCDPRVQANLSYLGVELTSYRAESFRETFRQAAKGTGGSP